MTNTEFEPDFINFDSFEPVEDRELIEVRGQFSEQLPKKFFPWRLWHVKSLGFRLFAAILSGGILSLGGMSYFFYHMFRQQVEDKVRVILSERVNSTEELLTEIERQNVDVVTSVQFLRSMGTKDQKIYQKLVLKYFDKRSKLTMGFGIGQAPYQIVPELQWFYPYIYSVEGIPEAANNGKPIPEAPNYWRSFDLYVDDNYPQKDYYTIPIAKKSPVWIEPYRWYGVTITSFITPFYDEKNTLLGVVSNDVNVTELSKKVQGGVIGNEGYFTILSTKGNILAYPPNTQKAQEIANYQTIPELKDVWLKVQAGSTGQTIVGGKLWAYERIPKTNWIVLAAVPESVIFTPIAIATLVASLVSITILAIAIILFIRYLNIRLQPILNECNRLVRKKNSHYVEQKAEDEIERITVALFSLLEEIDRNEENLRQEITRWVQDREEIKQKDFWQQENELLQTDIGHILEIVSSLEDGDLTIQAEVSDRPTGLVADTLNRLTEGLSLIVSAVVSVAQQVAQGAEHLEKQAIITSSQAQQQTKSVSETQILIQKVNEFSQATAEQALLSDGAVGEAQEAVERGQKDITIMSTQIFNLQEGMKQIVKRAQLLDEFVNIATQFSKDQKRVAALTRVLALNASMIAARASGQQDPDQFASVANEFSTIATQVNDLAVQTSQSLILLQQRTDQIQTVVSGINQDVQEIDTAVNQFTTSVDSSRQVFEKIKKVTERVVLVGTEVTRSSQEIANLTNTSLQAIDNISQLANQTEFQARFTREQAGWMEQMAHSLLEKIDFFKIPDHLLEQYNTQDTIAFTTPYLTKEKTSNSNN
jgi:twitching motility protein PilJ